MKITCAFLSLFCLGAWLLLGTHVSFNASSSLPYEGFFCVKHLDVKRGDLVCLRGHETAYAPGAVLTKRLIGLPGDRILRKGRSVFVNDTFVGKLRPKTRDGRPLTPLQKGIIPQGFVFVGADHPRSFDSRYREFGLVDQNCIQGRCFGVFRKQTS